VNSVLVTGSKGFLGSAIVRAIARTLPDFTILNPSRSELDLENLDQVRDYWKLNKPTHLIHAAAFARGLGGNIEAREIAFIRNEAVVRTPLLAALEFGAKSVIFCGTVAEYGFPYAELPLRETSLFDGPPHIGERYYGLAKRGAQTYLAAIDEKWGKISTHALLTNLYGPGDRFDAASGHVIPSMLLNFANARKTDMDSIVLWGVPETTRDFLYVEDAAAALVALLSADADIVNVASGIETSMGEVASLIKEKTKFSGDIHWDASKPIGIPNRSVDISLLKSAITFTPVTLGQGISRTLEVEAWIGQ